MVGQKMLDAINQGRVTVSIDGKPVISLDGSTKSLGLDMAGLEGADLKISSLFQAKKSKGRVFLESSKIMRKIAKNGWKFSLYDKGEQILTTGSTSRLGPHLYFNPLKLRRMLRVI